MPYKLSETPKGFFVINTETGEKKNKDPLPEARAKKYMAALYAAENKKEFSLKELFADLVNYFSPKPAKPSPSFTVFKDDTGQYRWVLISSNAYRDRDGEIVSQKALQADVERADMDGEFGELDWWHVPGLDIGDCDFNMLHGKMLIESGTFRDARVAKSVSEKADELEASIAFRHPPDEPDKNGVFNNIHRFKRSLVPKGRASNPFTSLTVTKEGDIDMTTLSEKLQAFKTLLKDDELAGHILAQASAKEKELDTAGVAFKEETPDPEKKDPVTVDNPGDAATSHKAEEGVTVEVEAEEPDESPNMVTELKAMLEECKTMLTEMKGMYSKAKDDATVRQQEQATALKTYQDKLTALEQQQTATITALTTSQKEIRALMGDLPKNMLGYLASAAEDTVVEKDDEKLKELQPHADPLSDFTKNFVFQGTPFASQTN